MIVFALLIVGVLVLGLIVALGLRRWTLDEGEVEARLHDPTTHKLVYAVPAGQDPGVLIAALARSGYVAVSDLEGGVERLLVECGEVERARVRDIIEHVDRAGFDGPEMHVAHVTFEDER